MSRKSDKEFLIRVRADIKQAVGELKNVGGQMKKTGTDGKKAAGGVSKLEKSMNQLVLVTKVYVALRVARGLILQADAFKVLSVRIKTATKDTGDYVRVSKQLYDISQSNGQTVKTSVALFQSIGRAAPELDATNQEILKVINSVEQLGVISGVASANQKAGLLQLSQGFSSSIFRAEEFNSLLENIPEVAKRIAKGMNLTTGELRQLIVDGQVLSKDVFESLKSQAADIAADFADIPDSVERSESRFVNAWSRMLSAVDDKLHVTDFYRYLVNNETALFEVVSDFLTDADASEFNKQIDDAIFHVSDLIQKMGDLKSVDIKNAFELIAQNIEAAQSKMEEIYNTTPNVLETEDELRQLDELSQQIEELKAQRQVLADALKNVNSNNNDVVDPKAATSIKKIIDALKLQADTFGQSNEAIAIHRLQLLGAANDELNLAGAIIKRIDEMKEAARLQTEGNALFEKMRTASEKLYAEMDRLNNLVTEGAVDWETYNRAMNQVDKDLDDLAKSDVWKELTAAVQGWGKEAAAAMAEMTVTGEDLWKEFANSVIRQILRILYYQSIVQPFINSLGINTATTGGATGGITGDAVAGISSHTGGVVGVGGVSHSFPAAIFNGAPRYHRGGIAGLRPNELPTVLELGEEVLTANDPRHRNNIAGQNGGTIKVEVSNKGGAKQASDVNVSRSGSDVVVGIVMDDMQTGGPISRGFQKTFNLNRSGR
ncbi:MAG: tape measure protein [Gammaproteobacteria bacterium]|nr:tape measure protein [Gammaproteobacteria bacterium]